MQALKKNDEQNTLESFYSWDEYSWQAKLFLVSVDVASVVAHSG